MLRPSKDYYLVELIEEEKRPGSLIMVDEERLPIRKAKVLAVPQYQDQEYERVVGDIVLIQQHYSQDFGMKNQVLIKKDYILAEVL